MSHPCATETRRCVGVGRSVPRDLRCRVTWPPLRVHVPSRCHVDARVDAREIGSVDTAAGRVARHGWSASESLGLDGSVPAKADAPAVHIGSQLCRTAVRDVHEPDQVCGQAADLPVPATDAAIFPRRLAQLSMETMRGCGSLRTLCPAMLFGPLSGAGRSVLDGVLGVCAVGAVAEAGRLGSGCRELRATGGDPPRGPACDGGQNCDDQPVAQPALAGTAQLHTNTVSQPRPSRSVRCSAPVWHHRLTVRSN